MAIAKHITAVSKKTGISWSAVFMFSLLLAFILYTASVGSLTKYKEFLFGSVGGSDSASSLPTTAAIQGQGVDAQTEKAIQNSVAASQNSSGLLGGIESGMELAGTVAMFL